MVKRAIIISIIVGFLLSFICLNPLNQTSAAEGNEIRDAFSDFQQDWNGTFNQVTPDDSISNPTITLDNSSTNSYSHNDLAKTNGSSILKN